MTLPSGSEFIMQHSGTDPTLKAIQVGDVVLCVSMTMCARQREKASPLHSIMALSQGEAGG